MRKKWANIQEKTNTESNQWFLHEKLTAKWLRALRKHNNWWKIGIQWDLTMTILFRLRLLVKKTYRERKQEKLATTKLKYGSSIISN